MPVVVDKDVALVEVGQSHHEGALAETAISNFREQSTYHGQRGKLIFTVALMMDQIWLVLYTLVVTSQDVGQVRVN